MIQDQEGNVLKDAIITVKNKAGIDLAGTKDDTSGTFKLTSKVNLGEELTIDYKVGDDEATAKVIVGKKEDNTQDKDDEKIFTKYLKLTKTKVYFFINGL